MFNLLTFTVFVQMCTRINNITAITKFLDEFVKKLASAFKIKCELKKKLTRRVPAKERHVFFSGRESQLSVQGEFHLFCKQHLFVFCCYFCLYPWKIQACCPGHTPQLSALLSRTGSY